MGIHTELKQKIPFNGHLAPRRMPPHTLSSRGRSFTDLFSCGSSFHSPKAVLFFFPLAKRVAPSSSRMAARSCSDGMRRRVTPTQHRPFLGALRSARRLLLRDTTGSQGSSDTIHAAPQQPYAVVQRSFVASAEMAPLSLVLWMNVLDDWFDDDDEAAVVIVGRTCRRLTLAVAILVLGQRRRAVTRLPLLRMVRMGWMVGRRLCRQRPNVVVVGCRGENGVPNDDGSLLRVRIGGVWNQADIVTGVRVISALQISEISFGSQVGASDEMLRELVAAHSLSTLHIGKGGRHITDVGIEMLCGCHQRLTSLSLHNCEAVTNRALIAIAWRLPCLTSLDVNYSAVDNRPGGDIGISDDGIAALSGLHNLASLSLQSRRAVTMRGIACMAAPMSPHRTLRFLDLTACTSISDTHFHAIRQFPAVSTLILSGCHALHDESVAHVASLPALTVLDLSNCIGVSDAAMRHLAARRDSLVNLNVSNTQVTDDGLNRGVSRLVSLTRLSIHGCDRITDDGVAHLPRLVALRDLDLGDIPSITDAGLRALAAAGDDAPYREVEHPLQHLRLNGQSRVTDRGLSHVAMMTSLTALELTSCDSITDSGLLILSHQLMYLRFLNVSWCSSLSEKGIQAARNRSRNRCES